MSADLVFDVTASSAVVAKAQKVGVDGEKAVVATMYQQGEMTMSASQKIVPVDTGTLKDSKFVRVNGNTVELGYGGAASAYAWEVHENLAMRHAKGKSAKFLQIPLQQRAKIIQQAVELAVKKAISGARSA